MRAGITEWDLVVVGARPASSAAAIAAMRTDATARVLLVDSADFPRDKVCGDGIAPHAMDVLASLGVDIDQLTAGTEPITRSVPAGATTISTANLYRWRAAP